MTVSLWKRLVRPFTVNDITTGESEMYPELKPLETSASPEKVLEALKKLFDRQGKRWRLSGVDHDEHRAEGEIETALFGFIDDVTIRIKPTETNDSTRSKVNIRSRSRVGKGDLGKNARNIRRLKAGLKRMLSSG
jgi:uncharacterized protein (DUF1499 family)